MEYVGLLAPIAFVFALAALAFYSSTGFFDPLGFIAGIIYGIVIEYVGLKYGSELN